MPKSHRAPRGRFEIHDRTRRLGAHDVETILLRYMPLRGQNLYASQSPYQESSSDGGGDHDHEWGQYGRKVHVVEGYVHRERADHDPVVESVLHAAR